MYPILVFKTLLALNFGLDKEKRDGGKYMHEYGAKKGLNYLW